MAKMGRPKIELNWRTIEQLASIHCTHEEIAFVVGVSVDTLERHSISTHGITFAEFCRQKRKVGKASLRRTMWDNAVNKNNITMMIWLSKQHLEMSDKVENLNENINTEKVYVAEWGGKHEQSDDSDKE